MRKGLFSVTIQTNHRVQPLIDLQITQIQIYAQIGNKAKGLFVLR